MKTRNFVKLGLFGALVAIVLVPQNAQANAFVSSALLNPFLRSWLGNAVVEFYREKIVPWVTSLAQPVLSPLHSWLAGLNSPYGTGTAAEADILSFFAAANAWVPMGYGFVLVTGLLSIRLGVLVYRHTIKHVPTVG